MLASAALILAAGLVTSSPDVVSFDARLAAGPSTRLDRDITTEGFFEIGALLRIRLDGGHSRGFVPIVMPEFSYTLTAGSMRGDHAAVLGCGYGFRYGPFVTGLVPGIVVGEFRGNDSQSVATGGGLRLLAVAEIEHFVGLQAGYTGVLRDGDFVHEVHASVSLNFLGLAVFYIANER